MNEIKVIPTTYLGKVMYKASTLVTDDGPIHYTMTVMADTKESAVEDLKQVLGIEVRQ